MSFGKRGFGLGPNFTRPASDAIVDARPKRTSVKLKGSVSERDAIARYREVRAAGGKRLKIWLAKRVEESPPWAVWADNAHAQSGAIMLAGVTWQKSEGECWLDGYTSDSSPVRIETDDVAGWYVVLKIGNDEHALRLRSGRVARFTYLRHAAAVAVDAYKDAMRSCGMVATKRPLAKLPGYSNDVRFKLWLESTKGRDTP